MSININIDIEIKKEYDLLKNLWNKFNHAKGKQIDAIIHEIIACEIRIDNLNTKG